MKTQYKLFILAVLLFGATSCFDSSDSVDWRTINRVVLSDPKAGEAERIVIDRFEVLNLTPQITQSQAADNSNLEYKWTIRENTSTINPYDYYDLAETPALNVAIDAKVGVHKIIFSVTDKLTGVSEYLYYDIEVIGEYTRGWTILEELPGGGDIAMILPTGRVARNIYSGENGEYLETPCRSLTVSNLASMKKVFVLTATQGVECSLEEFTRISEFADWFVPGTEPAAEDIKPALYTYTYYLYGGMINNGQYHARVGGGFPGDPAFGGAIPAPVEADGFRREYRAAPFIVGSDAYSNSSMQTIYDNLHKRFLHLSMDGLTLCLKSYPYDPADPWNPQDTGMTLSYMDAASVANIFNALMYDDNNDLYVLKFDNRATITTGVSFAQSIAAAPAVLNGFGAAVSSKVLDHMYVAVGNRLYHYDVPAGSATLGYTFAANEVPVCLRTLNDSGKETLYVATHDGTQGRVYYFPLEATGALSGGTYSERFEGFGKIVDMQYKE